MFGARVITATPDPNLRRTLREILTKTGFVVPLEAGDTVSLLQAVRQMQPDLAILDLPLPGRNIFEVIRIIEEERLSPLLLLTKYKDRDLVQQAKEASLFSYLNKPVDENNLLPAVEFAILSFQRMISLEKKIQKLQESIETRKLVERAKGILMAQLGLTETEAFRMLQQYSMKNRQPMRRVAESIIITYSFQQKKKGPD